MENSITERANSVPAQNGRNVFASYGESAGGGGYIVGELLKFSKGDWLAGQFSRQLPDGSKLIACMESLIVGWQRWENQRPVSYKMGLLIDGFKPAKREELGDTDQGLWEEDENGPRDPWQLTNYLQFIDPESADRQVLTFTTASKGGLGAVGKLSLVYGTAREKENRDDQYPLVTLGTGSYPHKDRSLGRIKFPTFNIIGWVRRNDLSKVVDPIGDSIPY